ncbi:Transcriptional regulatory protein AfsQ1 [Aquisphaera giovannonii]|uniref:histidine kinase n=1 Tax=Aquisphaera giovannonii TaxID=406548 RepID=A0A5B9WDR8_9BACT|nr:HPr family phosphocarrier protein [Aquisphaera giovannonii]QEH38722.1 Transcriptional regulatory protein AfsQ1 [Aquisphaera giovannonii]
MTQPHDRLELARVLVVDDDRDNAESLGCLLQLYGHHVEIALDGREAIRAARDLRPDFVLLDVALPEMDGYEIAGHLRREAQGAMTLIAITGYGRDEDRRRTREAGFDHHFVKPLDGPTLDVLIALMGGEAAAWDDGHAGRRDGRPTRDGDGPAKPRRLAAVNNVLGLHLRAAGRLSQLASRFRAAVRVGCDGRTADGRSVLELTTLGAPCGAWLVVEADGEDAPEAVEAVIALIERGFDE